jgi:hypothetical protein
MDLCRRYISFFEPDVFVDATGKAGVLGYGDDKVDFWQPRMCQLNEFVTGEEHRGYDFAFGLSMFDVYKHLYQEEFKFVRKQEVNFARMDPSSKVNPFFTATLGVFPDDEELAYLEQGYINVFNPSAITSDSAGMEKLIRREVSTPLGLTNFSIEIESGWQKDPLIFIFNPDVPADLIDYWNIRITERHVIPVSVHWFEQASDLIREIIERNYRPLPGNPHGVMIHTTLEFASSIGEEEAKTLTESFRDLSKGSWGFKLWHTPLWDRCDDDRIAHPTKARLDAGWRNAELLFPDERLTAWIDTISPKFANRFSGPANHARWVNILGLRSIYSDSALALCFPIKQRIAEFPKLRTLREALVSREGIVLFQQHKDWRDLLEWTRGREAITAWLEAHNVEATPSDAGRTAEELIKAVGNLHGVRLFAHEKTIRKLDAMAARRVEGEREHERSKEYPDRSAPVEDWRALLSRRVNQFRLHNVELEDFVKANVFRLGIVVPCSHCQKQNWYSLDDLSAKLICIRCLNSFSFPEGDINPKRTSWHYRVVGPFSVPDFASGGYATALTLRLFARGLGTTDVRITYATGLDLKLDQLSMEVDFVLWFQKGALLGDNKDPATLFGEAKSYAERAFSGKDIERLQALGRRFPGSFLVVSCLKDELSKAEKERIRKLAEWGRLPDSDGRPRAPVIVLLGSDLFFEWHLQDGWKERGGKFADMIGGGYVDLTNLFNLADITQRAYLDMPPYFDWLHKRYEALSRRRKLVRKGGEA